MRRRRKRDKDDLTWVWSYYTGLHLYAARCGVDMKALEETWMEGRYTSVWNLYKGTHPDVLRAWRAMKLIKGE